MSARAWSAFAAVSTLWGIPYLFIKVAVDDGVPPVFLAWARVTLAAIVLLALSARAGVLRPALGRLRWLAVYALAEIVIPFPLIGAGEQHVASSLAAILIAAVPMLVALLAIRFEPAERATGRRAVGLVVGFAGVVALVGLDVSGSRAELLGALAILLAAVGYAAGPMLMSRHLTDLDPRALMAVALSIASLALVVPALAHPPAATPSGEAIASILLLGLLCTAAAFVLFSVLIGEVGPGRATVITYVSPVVAVALGVTVLGERPGPGAVAGLLLILAGSWLSTDGRIPPGITRAIARVRGRLPNPVISDRQSSQAERRLSPRSITTMSSPIRLLVAAVLVPAALLLAACGSSNDSTSTSSSASATTSTAATSNAAAACQKGSLATQTPGQLTVATDKPAYPPYFVDDKPSNGKGFESAVAYAVAKQLGFAPADVKWVVVPFNSSYAPGPKKFDFDVNQISITPARSKHVDFSKPYYTAQQAVVALKSSPEAKATSLADLKDAKLGVQIGTTSLDAVNAKIQPSSQPRVYNDSNDVVRALKGKQIDAIVVDVPTAFYLTAAQVPQAKIVGQFSAPGGDTWGALLAKGSKLTPCVSQAVDKLAASGQLKQIESQWMGAAAGAPELR